MPLQFIYNDIGMSDFSVVQNLLDVYHDGNGFYHGHLSPTGNWVIKYPMGVAVLSAPFFFIGHVFAGWLGYPQDGMSLPYQVCNTIGSLTYLFLGLLALRKALLQLFTDRVVALCMVGLVFGTNLWYQSTAGLNTVHIYEFALLCGILLVTIKWHKKPAIRTTIWLGLLLGLAALTRPTDIVFAIIPLLWGAPGNQWFNSKLGFIRRNWKQIILLFLLAGLAGLPQLLYWKSMTGTYFYNSYTDNGVGLDFDNPHIMDVVFSFRKGWFVYTPLMAISFIGLFFCKRNLKIRPAIIVFVLVNVYVVSCWSFWWYSHSFGHRAMVDSYAVMIIGLGGIITASSNTINKYIVGTITGLCIILNLFQTWQMDVGIIDGTRMTRAYYTEVFGTIEVNEEAKELLLVGRSYPEVFTNEHQYESRILTTFHFDEIKSEFESENAYSGTSSLLLCTSEMWSETFRIPYQEITENNHAWIRGEFMLKTLKQNTQTDAYLVMYMDHDGMYKYNAFKLDTICAKAPEGEWVNVRFDYLSPEIRDVSDELVVNIWFSKGDSVVVDELSVTAFTLK